MGGVASHHRRLGLARVDDDDFRLAAVAEHALHIIGWAMQGLEPMNTSTSDSSKSA